jgi:hypothetical protein
MADEQHRERAAAAAEHPPAGGRPGWRAGGAWPCPAQPGTGPWRRTRRAPGPPPQTWPPPGPGSAGERSHTAGHAWLKWRTGVWGRCANKRAVWGSHSPNLTWASSSGTSPAISTRKRWTAGGTDMQAKGCC